MTTQHTDGRLVARVRDGDLEALGELYGKYKTQIYRTALAITRDERAAEDILQEAFLRVYAYADSIDGTVPLGPWLYRVTVNLAYSWTSRVKRWIHSLQGTLDGWSSSPYWLPEAEAEEQEQREILQQAIDALPASQRLVVILYYLEGMFRKGRLNPVSTMLGRG
jgi:RNA polymerase sigma-70 factor (ECF subfamily)